MSDQKIRVRTTVILEQLVDLDSYGGMTAQEAVRWEEEGQHLADRLMAVSEATEYTTFVERLEDLKATDKPLGHLVTIARAEQMGEAAGSAETFEKKS